MPRPARRVSQASSQRPTAAVAPILSPLWADLAAAVAEAAQARPSAEVDDSGSTNENRGRSQLLNLGRGSLVDGS